MQENSQRAKSRLHKNTGWRKWYKHQPHRLRLEMFFLDILVGLFIFSNLGGILAALNPVKALTNNAIQVVEIEKRIEVIKEVEVDRKFTTEKQQIMAYIVEVFGDDAANAITVINKCENHAFNPKATNHNRNGSIDRGIFQLNSAYWGGEELFDWKTNVDVAYKVFTRAGKKWTPWTCAHTVGQANYLGQ